MHYEAPELVFIGNAQEIVRGALGWGGDVAGEMMSA